MTEPIKALNFKRDDVLTWHCPNCDADNIFEYHVPCACGYHYSGRDVFPILTLQELIAANLSRVTRWHPLASWSPLEWAGAMCGEAGEAANAAKKLKRIEDQFANIDGRLFGQTLTLVEQAEMNRKLIGKEVADTIIYGVLLCARVDVDLVAAIREAFNKKSEEYGFPERL